MANVDRYPYIYLRIRSKMSKIRRSRGGWQEGQTEKNIGSWKMDGSSVFVRFAGEGKTSSFVHGYRSYFYT